MLSRSLRFRYSRSLFVNEAVDGIPPLPLSVGGQEAKKRKGEAAWLVELLLLLLVHCTADLCRLLKLTMATEHHTIYKHLDGGNKKRDRE